MVQEKVAAKKKIAEEYWRKNHVIASELKEGDKVLVRNMTRPKKGPSKLKNYWEEDIYIIKDVGGNGGVVYTIDKEGEERKTRTVHRNMIRPC